MGEDTFVDTTLRDGRSSLWGCRMTTGMLLSIVAQMDRAGFSAMEADSCNTNDLYPSFPNQFADGAIPRLGKCMQ